MKSRVTTVVVLAGTAVGTTTAGPTAVTFTDVTAAAGVSYTQHSIPMGIAQQAYFTGAAAAADVDNDGWVDLYVTRVDSSDILFRNNGDGTFSDHTIAAFGASPPVVPSNGAQFGDIDNDGDQDLYVLSILTNRYDLYINDGTGQFTEEALLRGAAIDGADTHYGMSSAFGDYDLDGYLDMYTGEWRKDESNPTGAPMNIRLLRNLGAAQPGHFEDVTNAAGVAMDAVPPSNPAVFDSQGFAPRFTDLDADGLPDLILSSDHQTSRLFWNNGDGTFTDGTDAANVGTDTFGMGSTVGDYDGDGDLDWFVTSIFDNTRENRDGNRLYRNDGNRVFTDVTDIADVRDGAWGWGAVFFDADNDGDLDLTHTNGVDFQAPFFNASSHGAFVNDATRFWINDGAGVFTESAVLYGITDSASGKGMLQFDYDRDGDQDLFVTNCGGTPVLYRNDGGNSNNWLRVEVTGTQSNRDGIGAFLTLTPDLGMATVQQVREIDGGNNFLSHDERVAHFGVGDATTLDQLVIRWPSGTVQTLVDIAPNTTLSVTEPVACACDTDASGDVSVVDLLVFLDRWFPGSPEADFNGDSTVSVVDLLDFLDCWFVASSGACD